MCVSTGIAGLLNATINITFAVFLPTPGKLTKLLKSDGTSPLNSSQIFLAEAIIFFALLYFSYTNFNAVKDGKEPTGYKNVEKYVKNDRNVIVYDYTVYKIEVIKYSGVETYTLKPFFIENY